MNGYSIQSVHKPPRFRVDKSCCVSFDTGELTTEQKLAILEHDGQLGVLFFVPEDKQIEDVKHIESEYKEKSHSTRLHNVLYVFWQQQGGEEKLGQFRLFYESEMEHIIQGFKDKLV